MREGAALLQGIATLRPLRPPACAPTIAAATPPPGTIAPASIIVEGRGVYCLNIGGVQIDQAVTAAFLAALHRPDSQPPSPPPSSSRADRDAASRSGASRSSAPATKHNGPSVAIAPSTPTTVWSRAASKRNGNRRLRALRCRKGRARAPRAAAAARHYQTAERDACSRSAPISTASGTRATTTPRDRKELLRTLIEEVTISVDRDKASGRLTMRWQGGAAHRDRDCPAAFAAGHRAHRRRHDRPRAPPRRPLPRRRHRRHPQSARARPRPTAIASPPAASAVCAAIGSIPCLRADAPTRRTASS